MKNFSKYYLPAVLVGLLVVIGVSVNYHYQETEETVTFDDQMLERAYHDLVAEEEMQAIGSEEEQLTYKIFSEEDELLDFRILSPEELPDEDFSTLLHQSSLIAEYNNSYIYKIKD
jgi:hypothetical protein